MSTHASNERVFIAKDEDVLRELGPHSEEIKIDNKIDDYAKWPKTSEHQCLAECVSQLESTSGYHNNTNTGTCDSEAENTVIEY